MWNFALRKIFKHFTDTDVLGIDKSLIQRAQLHEAKRLDCDTKI
jgi:hypothetical protein